LLTIYCCVWMAACLVATAAAVIMQFALLLWQCVLGLTTRYHGLAIACALVSHPSFSTCLISVSRPCWCSGSEPCLHSWSTCLRVGHEASAAGGAAVAGDPLRAARGTEFPWCAATAVPRFQGALEVWHWRSPQKPSQLHFSADFSADFSAELPAEIPAD